MNTISASDKDIIINSTKESIIQWIDSKCATPNKWNICKYFICHVLSCLKDGHPDWQYVWWHAMHKNIIDDHILMCYKEFFEYFDIYSGSHVMFKMCETDFKDTYLKCYHNGMHDAMKLLLAGDRYPLQKKWITDLNDEYRSMLADPPTDWNCVQSVARVLRRALFEGSEFDNPMHDQMSNVLNRCPPHVLVSPMIVQRMKGCHHSGTPHLCSLNEERCDALIPRMLELGFNINNFKVFNHNSGQHAALTIGSKLLIGLLLSAGNTVQSFFGCRTMIEVVERCSANDKYLLMFLQSFSHLPECQWLKNYLNSSLGLTSGNTGAVYTEGNIPEKLTDRKRKHNESMDGVARRRLT
jgi:hypothetical protein